jgi:RimJ/RimL family protein N-acetyltransferase
MADAIIETARLRLRPLSAADADPLWAIWAEEPVRRFLITVPHAREDFEAMFGIMLAQSEAGHLWAIEDRRTGALIGRCGFYVWAPDDPPEFAILLAEASWGQGLATEATRAALDFAFRRRGWGKVVAVARPANGAVRKVLGRAGFREARLDELRGAPALWFSAVPAEP